jgi:prophage regulatory protein
MHRCTAYFANRVLAAIVRMSYELSRPPPPAEHRILRRSEVERRTGFKRAYIYTLIKAGKFPKGRRIGVRAVGWDSAEVDEWIAQRLQPRL